MTEFEKISRVGPAMPVNGHPSQTQPQTNAGSAVNATLVALAKLSKTASASETPTAGVDPSQLQKLVGEIQGRVQDVQRALTFSVDEESGATVVKVIDTQTKEIIRQIPAEEVLSIASRLRAASGGLLLADTV